MSSQKGEFPLLDFFDPKKMIVTKEWARLFLSNWDKAVRLWDRGELFTEVLHPGKLVNQKEYARLCCSWIIIYGMVEPHVVAEGG